MTILSSSLVVPWTLCSVRALNGITLYLPISMSSATSEWRRIRQFGLVELQWSQYFQNPILFPWKLRDFHCLQTWSDYTLMQWCNSQSNVLFQEMYCLAGILGFQLNAVVSVFQKIDFTLACWHYSNASDTLSPKHMTSNPLTETVTDTGYSPSWFRLKYWIVGTWYILPSDWLVSQELSCQSSRVKRWLSVTAWKMRTRCLEENFLCSAKFRFILLKQYAYVVIFFYP